MADQCVDAPTDMRDSTDDGPTADGDAAMAGDDVSATIASAAGSGPASTAGPAFNASLASTANSIPNAAPAFIASPAPHAVPASSTLPAPSSVPPPSAVATPSTGPGLNGVPSLSPESAAPRMAPSFGAREHSSNAKGSRKRGAVNDEYFLAQEASRCPRYHGEAAVRPGTAASAAVAGSPANGVAAGTAGTTTQPVPMTEAIVTDKGGDESSVPPAESATATGAPTGAVSSRSQGGEERQPSAPKPAGPKGNGGRSRFVLPQSPTGAPSNGTQSGPKSQASASGTTVPKRNVGATLFQIQ